LATFRALSANSPENVKTFPYVMIFRRSLVRELTATTIGLFVVLLAILFTQSVIRILGRAAGGAIAADGVLALIGFNAMFYLNLLLSVALFLTVLLTLSRWYRPASRWRPA
jgi:lipopolysaccharide export system permease protein